MKANIFLYIGIIIIESVYYTMENCVEYKYSKIRLVSWKTNKHMVSAFFFNTYIYIYIHVCFIISNMSNFV